MQHILHKQSELHNFCRLLVKCDITKGRMLKKGLVNFRQSYYHTERKKTNEPEKRRARRALNTSAFLAFFTFFGFFSCDKKVWSRCAVQPFCGAEHRRNRPSDPDPILQEGGKINEQVDPSPDGRAHRRVRQGRPAADPGIRGHQLGDHGAGRAGSVSYTHLSMA